MRQLSANFTTTVQEVPVTAAATQRSRSTKAGLGKAIAAQKATQDAPQLQREQPRHAPSRQKSVLLIEIKKFTRISRHFRRMTGLRRGSGG
jgi:hypothetical protein